MSRTHTENSTAKSDKIRFSAEVCRVISTRRAKKRFDRHTPYWERTENYICIRSLQKITDLAEKIVSLTVITCQMI